MNAEPTNPTPHSTALERRDWPRRWQADFLEQLSLVPSVSSAAKYAGISREHAYDVRRQSPEFAAAWQEALYISRDLADRVVFTLGAVGEESVVTRETVKRNAKGEVVERSVVTETTNRRYPNLLMAWLKAHYPEKYGDDIRLRHTGEDGGPVLVEEVFREGDRERYLELLRLAREEHDDVEGSATRRAELEPGEDDHA